MSIKVGQAFERTSAQPIDVTLTLTKAQMLTVNDNLMPDYYFTICQDDGKIYLYDKTSSGSVTTGKFTEFSGGSGGSGDVKIFTTTDTLSDEINGTKVVLAADLPGVTWTDLKVGASLIKDAKGTLGLVTNITGTTSVTVTTANTSTPTKELTQAQYDALVAAGTVDPDTLYFIKDGISPAYYIGAKETVYDEKERIIGTYFGKPLYQKVISTGPFNIAASSIEASWQRLVASPTNAEELVLARFININNTLYQTQQSFAFNMHTVDPGYISVVNLRDNTLVANDARLLLQYTKSTDVAAASYFATVNDYSTEETVVGKWIDGSPLYQKTYTGTLPNTNVVKDNLFSIADLNMDKLIDIEATAYQHTSGEGEFTYTNNFHNESVEFSIWRRQDNYIGIHLMSDSLHGRPYVVTIRYTKVSS